MRVSVCLGAILIPVYLDFHSGYSAAKSRMAGIYSGIHSYSGIFPNERAPSHLIELRPGEDQYFIFNPKQVKTF